MTITLHMRKVKLTDAPVTVTRGGLKAGDKVTLLRHEGGQKFTVIEKR